MAYILTLCAILLAVLWVSPARTGLADGVRSGANIVRSASAYGSDRLTDSVRSLATTVREKAMELLRKELHQSVDELVR